MTDVAFVFREENFEEFSEETWVEPGDVVWLSRRVLFDHRDELDPDMHLYVVSLPNGWEEDTDPVEGEPWRRMTVRAPITGVPACAIFQSTGAGFFNPRDLVRLVMTPQE